MKYEKTAALVPNGHEEPIGNKVNDRGAFNVQGMSVFRKKAQNEANETCEVLGMSKNARKSEFLG
ncbi:MAG: hypothetical protein E7590_01635 [Ruminococcaceae bacterium]|nr:hypothetical protein [Oscillospiraceae bacterium]